jgi:hypothetical protein
VTSRKFWPGDRDPESSNLGYRGHSPPLHEVLFPHPSSLAGGRWKIVADTPREDKVKIRVKSLQKNHEMACFPADFFHALKSP